MKGEVRNPTTVWLMSFCGVYQVYWWYLTLNELKNYLGKEEMNPTVEVVIGLVTGGIYLWYLPLKYGKVIQEAQQRAGIASPEDQGSKFLMSMFLCWMGYKQMQTEINRIWESGGGAPATF
jgi:hypothetical protein